MLTTEPIFLSVVPVVVTISQSLKTFDYILFILIYFMLTKKLLKICEIPFVDIIFACFISGNFCSLSGIYILFCDHTHPYTS